MSGTWRTRNSESTSFLQPTWLQPGQSMMDYIAARRAENARLAEDRLGQQPRSQIGRKTVDRRSVTQRPQPLEQQQRHRHVSRMTPAPPDRTHDQGIVIPTWGIDDTEFELLEFEDPPLPLKRNREPEPLRLPFIDLAAIQSKYDKRFSTSQQPPAEPSVSSSSTTSRLVHSTQVYDFQELNRRVGKRPQKKKRAPLVSQVAYKSVSRTFQTRMAAATQMKPKPQSRPFDGSLVRAYTPRSAARKVAPATSLSSDEEIDELDPSSAESEDLPRFNRPQTLSGLAPKPRRSQPDNQGGGIDSRPSPTSQGLSSTPDPLVKLFRAFQLHTLPADIFQEAKQLPFLTRNLRKSFKILCRDLNIPSTPLPEDRQGTVLVRYEHVANASFGRSLPKWFCPLCNLLGMFATREMLAVHLKTTHREMFVEWVQPVESEAQDGVSWRLHILLPEIDEKEIGSAQPLPTETIEPSSEAIAATTPSPVEQPVFSIPKHRFITPPVSPANQRTPPSSRRRPPLGISPFTSPTSKGKAPAATERRKPRPSQYPRPPPSSNRKGPAARPPYLPAKSIFGGPDIYYSTRPGGPYLFDFLGLLPLEPFGIFDGMVVDREEELWSDDDLPEEEKVIIALWARWIMLNKVEFDRDRPAGVKRFIDEYWRMIHLAAGWQALVYQLLVLAAWRLLNHQDIIPLIEHYEELVGMEFWDEWDSNEE